MYTSNKLFPLGRAGSFFNRRKLIGFSPRVEHIFYWPLTAVIYCVSKGGERHLVGSAFLQKGIWKFKLLPVGRLHVLY